MKRYTVGFLFNKTRTHVLLIHKTKPAWQVGKINGVGGKVEPGETSIQCIEREVKEETNIDTDRSHWVFVGTISGGDAIIEVYGYIYDGVLFEAYTFEKEKIEWFQINLLPENIIPNLSWLIPLTLEKMNEKKIISFKVDYSDF